MGSFRARLQTALTPGTNLSHGENRGFRLTVGLIFGKARQCPADEFPRLFVPDIPARPLAGFGVSGACAPQKVDGRALETRGAEAAPDEANVKILSSGLR